MRKLFPLIVPTEYVNSGWKLPHAKFSVTEFVLTWVEFEGSSPMTYVNEMKLEELNAAYNNWQQQAFENLRLEGDYFHTHVKYRSNTQHVVYISFLNSDGIGSSRILLNDELSRRFTRGYYIAFPDRSCGLIISKDINDKELKAVKREIEHMYANATTPMSDKIYDPIDFALPNEWTFPIDEAFSAEIVKSLS